MLNRAVVGRCLLVSGLFWGLTHEGVAFSQKVSRKAAAHRIQGQVKDSHHRVNKKPMVSQVIGHLEEYDDGLLIMTMPIPEHVRRQISNRRQRPLSAIPKVRRRTIIHKPELVAFEEVQRHLKKRVKAEVKIDTSGFMTLTKLTEIDSVNHGKQP